MEQRINPNQAAGTANGINQTTNLFGINTQVLGQLFLVNGILAFVYDNIILAVIMTILEVFFKYDFNDNVRSILLMGVPLAAMTAFIIYFIRKRKSVVKNDNRYAMRLLYTWVVMMAAPMFLYMFAEPIADAVLSRLYDMYYYNMMLYYGIFKIIEYVVVCAGLFFSGYIIESRLIKILSVVFIILPPLAGISGMLAANVSDILEFIYESNGYTFLIIITAACYLILRITYIVMGIVFLKKQKAMK